MNPTRWREDLSRALLGRRFVGVAELESQLPGDLGAEDLEWIFDLLEERDLILVDEERGRPIGFFPIWEPWHWDAASGELGRPAVARLGEDPAERAHAELRGREPGSPRRGPAAQEDLEEPLEPPSVLYARMAGEAEALDQEEESVLLERVAAGDEEARNRVLASYLGRVVRLARRYERAGASHDDLIQAGNMGLVEALASFRPDGHRRFAGHADRAIRRAFGRHMAEERRTVRVPQNLDREIRRLLREHERLSNQRQRVPTHRELAEALGTDEDEVGYLMSFLQAPASLDVPSGPGEEYRLEEILADEQAPAPAEWSSRVGALERLEEMMEPLTVSHRRVVALRYGLLDGLAHTRKQVVARTGFSLEEVVRLEEEALDHLRRQGDLESL